VPAPLALGLYCELDDAVMQDGHTDDVNLIVADLVTRLSGDKTLLASTLIPASTPAGVGFPHRPPVFLAAGDRVSIAVEGVGGLTNLEEVT